MTTLDLNPFLSLSDNPLDTIAIKAQTTLDTLLDKEDKPEHFTIEENKIVTQQIEQANFKFCEKTKQRVTREMFVKDLR